MANRVTLPKFLSDPAKMSKYVSEAYGSALLGSTAKDLKEAGFDVKQINSKSMEVTIRHMAKKGIFDMKPFFKRSPKAMRKKDGTGWYMVVPIKLQRRGMRNNFDGGDRTYMAMKERFDKLEMGSFERKTIPIDEILNGVSGGGSLTQFGQSDISSALNYTPQSDNVTGINSKSGKRTSYFAFRTVSSKSKPQSWVMGRRNNDRVNSTNISKALDDGIRVLMNKRMKQMRLS